MDPDVLEVRGHMVEVVLRVQIQQRVRVVGQQEVDAGAGVRIERGAADGAAIRIRRGDTIHLAARGVEVLARADPR